LLHITDFSAQTPTDQLVPVNFQGWNGDPGARFKALATWVESGGTALFLNLPSTPLLKIRPGKSRMSRHIEKGTILPFSLSLYSSKGLWPLQPRSKRPSILRGLPSNCLMRQESRNVSSQWSIVKTRSDWARGNITYDWHAGLKHKQNFIGVTEAFYGANLTQISHGNGKYVLCTHRIVENLGIDTVADRLLSNLLY